MPGFIGTRASISRVSLGVILYFTAGPDQQTSCPPIVIDLQATVIGSLTGHTVLWEQMSGPAVTWTTPTNQLNVQFSAAFTSDRTFRFWIDKGFPYQQYEDLNVYGNPLDAFETGQIAAVEDTQPGSTRNCRSPYASLIPYFINNTSLISEAGCMFTSYQFLWNMPSCDLDKFLYFVIQQKCDGDNWITVASSPYPSAIPAVTGCTYRALAVYASNEIDKSISNSAIYSVQSGWYYASPYSEPTNGFFGSDKIVVGRKVEALLSSFARVLLTLVQITPSNYPDLGSDKVDTNNSGMPLSFSDITEVGYIMSANTGTEVLTSNTSNLLNNAETYIYGSSLPGGIVSGQKYYMQNLSGTTFQLSTLPFYEGSTINITSTGTGRIYQDRFVRTLTTLVLITPATNVELGFDKVDTNNSGMPVTFSTISEIGYVTSANTGTEIINCTLTNVAVNEKVIFTGLNLPAPLVSGQSYYIASAPSTSSLTVSIAYGGIPLSGVVTGVGGKWIFKGNYASIILVGQTFVISGTGAGDGTYTTASASDVADTTEITVTGTIAVGAVVGSGSLLVFNAVNITASGTGRIFKETITRTGFTQIGG